MRVGELFKSECGRYICRMARGACQFEAWTAGGEIHWRDDNRIVSWKDQAKFRYPMAYAIGGYSAEKTGQKSGSFTLTLLHCDTSKEVEPFRGNTIIESLDVVFRRKVPIQNIPRWLRPVTQSIQLRRGGN